jgi:hypothetical protein
MLVSYINSALAPIPAPSGPVFGGVTRPQLTRPDQLTRDFPIKIQATRGSSGYSDVVQIILTDPVEFVASVQWRIKTPQNIQETKTSMLREQMFRVEFHRPESTLDVFVTIDKTDGTLVAYLPIKVTVPKLYLTGSTTKDALGANTATDLDNKEIYPDTWGGDDFNPESNILEP